MGPPPPPESLSDSAKTVWHRIVVRLQPNWFCGSEALLETFCEITVTERQLAAELQKCGIENERYAELLRLYLSVAATMATLGTKLRLAPQSSRDSRHTKLTVPGPYPWEGRDSEEVEELPPAVPNEGNGDERSFNTLLHRQRMRRGVHATIAATEVADAASFRGTDQ